MHARTLTVFIFLLMVGAAWPASQQKTLSWNDQSGYLYQVYTTSGYDYIKLQPGFNGAFTSTLTIDDSKVLSYGPGGTLDGAVVCPGTTASLNSNMNALWSAPNFFAYAVVSESCSPGPSSASGGSFPVTWSKSDYDAMNNWGINLCYDNTPDCWGHEGTFYDKSINDYDLFGSPLTNRLGSVAVSCWGTRTPSATTPSGSYPGLSASDSGTSFQNTITLSGIGSYAIGDSYEVKGCVATVRHPVCKTSQTEEIYSRTAAQADTSAPEYDAPLGKSVYNIVVQNRQNALSCGLSGVPQPVTVSPGGYTVIPVTISNGGQVANYVTGVTSDNAAVAVTPFNNALCAQNGGDRPSTNPECCTNPPSCTAMPSNGFGPSQSMNPGNSNTVYVQVAVPAGTPAGSYSANLVFSFSSGQSACNAPASSALNCSAGALQVNAGAGDSCNITDGTMPVSTGSSRAFSIQCSHLNGAPGPCAGAAVSWAATPAGFGILGTNDYQSAQFTFPTEGTGDVTADVSGSFNAACAYSGNGQPVTVQNVTNCTITPASASVGYFELTPFSLNCMNDLGESVPCGTVAWNLLGLDGMTINPGPTGTSVFLESPVGTSGTLNATIGIISCASDLTVATPTDTLAVNPPSVSLPYNASQIFNTNCTHAGAAVECSGPQWNPTGFPVAAGSIAPDSGPITNYTATVDNIDTALWACALGITPSPCNFTSITVGAKPVPNVTSCNVTPPVANVGRLEVAIFGLQCYDSSNNTLPCVTATWALQGIDGILFNTGPTGASVVPISDIGSVGYLNATVGNVSCASNLTVVPPNNTLNITPPTANPPYLGNQSFDSNCTTLGVPVACSGVQWNPFPDPSLPFIGSINPLTGPSTVYTATTDNVSTALWACAFGMTPSPCNNAQITVGTPNFPPECTGSGCGPGVSKYCTISPGGIGEYSVLCGPSDNLKTCTSTVNWKLNGVPVCTGDFCTVSSAGQLVANIGKGQTCAIDVGPSVYQCLMVS